MIEASFSFDLQESGRRMWHAALLEREEAVAIEAAVMCCRTMNKRPTLRDLLDLIAKRERDLGYDNAEKRGLPEDEWRGTAPRPPAWVFGWLIARYRDRDMRLWPEQERGFAAQRDSGGGHAYNWKPEELMPDEDRDRYIEEGRGLSSEQLWRVVGGLSPDPAAE